MAVGDLTSSGNQHSLEILATTTAANGVPSAATDGISTGILVGNGNPETVSFVLFSTAGSATMTVDIRLWGYHGAGAKWVPVGTGDGTTNGKLNAGAQIAESAADSLVHSETIAFPSHFTRLYIEVTAIGGTATAVEGHLVWNAPNR